MRELVDQSLANLRLEREERHVEIAVGDLTPCQGDPTLLEQVWLNLLSKVFKFTDKQNCSA